MAMIDATFQETIGKAISLKPSNKLRQKKDSLNCILEYYAFVDKLFNFWKDNNYKYIALIVKRYVRL